MVRELIKRMWPPGVSSESVEYSAVQTKLSGQPFSGRHGVDELHGRRLVCHLLAELSAAGWSPVGSFDVSAKHIRTENGPDFPNDVHSWFFAKTAA